MCHLSSFSMRLWTGANWLDEETHLMRNDANSISCFNVFVLLADLSLRSGVHPRRFSGQASFINAPKSSQYSPQLFPIVFTRYFLQESLSFSLDLKWLKILLKGIYHELHCRCFPKICGLLICIFMIGFEGKEIVLSTCSWYPTNSSRRWQHFRPHKLF